MAGILDFLETPDAQLGIGLLAAGGPMTDPNASGFGARLASGVGYAQNAKAAAARQKLIDSQIAENESQNAVRAATLARQQRQDAYYLGGGAPGAAATPGLLTAAPTAAGGGAVPAPAPSATVGAGAVLKAATGVPQDAPTPSQGKFAEWSKAYNIPIDALVTDYFSNGGKGIADMLFKAARPDMKESSGGYVYDANRVQPGFLPGLKQAADGTAMLSLPDPSAPGGVRVQAPEGALGTAGAYATQKARTNAAYTPGRPVIDPATGYKVGQSQLSEVGGGPTQPLIGRNFSGPGYAGGSAGAAAGGQADIFASELRTAQAELSAAQQRGDAAAVTRAQADIAGLQREIGRLPGGAAPAPTPASAPLIGPGAAIPPAGAVEYSPAAQTAQDVAKQIALDRAKQQTGKEATADTATKKLGQMTAAAEIAMKLLDEGPTGSGVGALADRAAAFVGQPLKGMSQAQQLKAIGGWLVSNVPRMEGPQSDRDVANYAIMAGTVGDETLPAPVRKEALKTVIALQNKYSELNGAPGASTIPGTPPQPAGNTWKPPAGVVIREVKK